MKKKSYAFGKKERHYVGIIPHSRCIMSSPIAISDGAGITMLKDTSDNTILLAIDYSRHDQSELSLARESVIKFNEGEYTDAESITGIPMRKLISGSGRLDGIVLTLRQHESAIVKLI